MTKKQQKQLVKKLKESVAMACAWKTDKEDMIRTMILITVSNYVTSVLNILIIDNELLFNHSLQIL